MAPKSILHEQSEMDGSSTLSEASPTKYQPSSGTKRPSSGTEDDSKKRGNSPLPETRAAKRQKNSGIKKYTSMAGNDSLSTAPNELEFEIEKAKFDIFNSFMNLKMQMDDNDKVMAKEMETWTKISLDNISDEKSSQNEFFIKGLIDNFEEVIKNVGEESRRDVDQTMDDIRKILVKLVHRIKQSFRQSPCEKAVKVTRSDTASFVWIGLGFLGAVLIGVFPDYLGNFFETAVTFFQSTILIIFFHCMLYFNDSSI